MNFIPFLQTPAGGSGNMLMTIMPFALIFAIFYFLMIRPQNKKQKETEQMISALKKGDKVITVGGIHGVISSTKEKTLIVKVDENTKIEFNRSAISTVVVDKPATAPVAAEKKGLLASLFGGKKDVPAEAKKEPPPEAGGASPAEPSTGDDKKPDTN
ncbi:MAG: preprotein translocase subunit YajC [Spirochaetaceae bacterium]|jgi:preprotein translocase subunit YajC|nr:preprotein translocase subunit YajC [Spirochaetaceae bacterium]